MEIQEALTFDDVLLRPAASSILPNQAITSTKLTSSITLNIPLLSAAMDTVTESGLAIAMAQAGGIGVIHRNFGIAEQAEEVRRVKKYESGMVINPLTIAPERKLSEALEMMDSYSISSLPVVESASSKLVGILTNRDVRFATDKSQPVSELMTNEDLISVGLNVDIEEAKRLLHKHRIEKLLVVDKDYRCIGLITVKDIEKSLAHPDAAKDDQGRLFVAAATSVGESGIERAEALIDAGVDLIVVDTAHGHSSRVIKTVQHIKKNHSKAQILAGNVATADAASALMDVGADSIKVGIGPGSICTTRIVAGVGVPQLTAVMEVVDACNKRNISVIADGGVRFSGDFAKAIAAGADAVMIGSLLGGTDEAPGEVFFYEGRSYKSYRGMGSVAAMARGSADRYFQEEFRDSLKLIPEGVEGRVPYKGPVSAVLHQLVGGLRAAMGYTGNSNISEMQRNCSFVRITGAGRNESHVHGVHVTRESPNYPIG